MLLQERLSKEVKPKQASSPEMVTLLANIVSSSSDAIISKTLDGIITSWNQGAEHLYGYTAQEAIGQHITFVFPEELKTDEEDIIAKIKAGKNLDHFETIRLTKSGNIVNVSLMISPIYNSEGRLIGASNIAHDITSLKEIQRKLQISEERYDLVVRGMSVGLWDWNSQTNILYLSDKFKEIFGIPKDVNVRCDEFVNLMHPEDKDATLEMFFEYLEHSPSYNVECRVRHMNGEYIWIHVCGQAQRDEHGMPLRMAGSVDDITNEKQTELYRNELLDKLTESNTDLERFAYVASHDMQEPLRMIANFGQLIKEGYGNKLGEEGNEYVQIMTDSAIRMQDMVSDLLEYARIGGGNRVVTVNASEELVHVLHNLCVIIEETDAVVTSDPLPDIACNPVQFISLLQNLIGNGIKYQKEGSKPAIHVGVEDQGTQWEFFVRDNGIGMELKHLSKIFDPFMRLHTWQEYQGSGIGLAICKKIVENHGGQIRVTSQPDQGTTFYFTLQKKQ